MWPTRIKLLLASMLLIVNTYEFLTVVIGGISQYLLILMEAIVWLSYGSILVFDLKRALYNDWSHLYPYHITLFLATVYALITHSL